MNTITFTWLGDFVLPAAQSPGAISSASHAGETLRAKGWTQREAAEVLGVHRVHLAYVLNGQRRSRRLMAAIAALPQHPSVGFARKGVRQ